jgi:cyanophycin synthetase
MGAPHLVAMSAQFKSGSVMGSAQATTLLKLRIIAPSPASLQRARSVLATVLPRWIAVTRQLEHTGPERTEKDIEVLFTELFFAIQLESGIAVANSIVKDMPSLKSGETTLYLASHNAKASEIAINWTIKVLNSLLKDAPVAPDIADSVNSARRLLTPFAEAGVNSFFILQAAYALGIPVFRPVRGLLVLGTGNRSKWLQSLISDKTTMLGAQFAQAKHITASLLRTAGLPGGIHRLVNNREQAISEAMSLGYPVVIKPADADRGAGVAAGLMDAVSVAQAFDAAIKVSRNVLVERWEPGHTHRLTVQDGHVVRVVRRTAGGVTGNGVNSIAELVALFQQTPPQQRFAQRLGHPPLSLDAEALGLLKESGLNAQSRPLAGVYVKLRRRDNVNAGGTNEELTTEDASTVHPDNVRLAIEAARVLRLDFAGIDLITTDISRSWLEVGALICEVNARPQMGGANDPKLYQRLLNRFFPEGDSIPAELLLLPSHAVEQERVRGQLLQQRLGAALSFPSGLWLDGRRSTRAFKNSFEAARSLLQRSEVSHAICCLTVNDIYQYGLPLQKWSRVTVLADAVFSEEETALLASIADWLQAAVTAS